MQPKIELARVRDFGEIISDTFGFIRQNFKPLLKYFFIFCGFFIIATATITIVLQVKSFSIFENVQADSFNDQGVFSGVLSLVWAYLLLALIMVLEYVAITVTVLCFITLYRQKQNNIPTVEEMWGYIKYYYLRILGCTILLYILLIVGFVFCLIPGIYLLPIFALIPPIMIMENTSFGYAFNKSFQLIKDNWWVTFGAIVVIYIMLYMANLIVAIPSGILGAGSVFLHIKNHGAALSLPIAIITSIMQSVMSVFRILMIVGISLCYFNLTETKEGTGLMDRINQFGTGTPEQGTGQEEY